MAPPILPGQPQTAAGRAWHAVRRWWQGRDWRAFRPAAPAALVGAGLLALAVVCATQSPRELQARYLAQGKGAFQAKDYPRAMTCYERVAPVADDPDAYYRLALAAEATGDLGRAAALMRGLAPEPKAGDKAGYAPAHYWWARKLLAASAEQRPDGELRGLRSRAEAHLVRAVDGDLGTDRSAALGLLGKLYLADRRFADAERCLAQAAPSVPLLRLDLARLHLAKERPDPDRARAEAGLAAKHFGERAKADLNNHPARLAWADSTALLEDFPGATTILEEGLAATGAPIFRAALAKAHGGWHDLRKKQGAPVGELLALLNKGLGYESGNRDLLDRMLAHLRVGGADADEAREALRGTLAKGTTASAHVHFALAVDARMRNDGAAEKLHLELALAADPKAASVANNLAYVLAQPPNPDLPRALATVNLALAREPTNPVFLDTRGHIYLGLKRWTEAATDLEAALARAPELDGVHAALATAYENLGQPEQAAKYRQQAQATRKPPAKP